MHIPDIVELGSTERELLELTGGHTEKGEKWFIAHLLTEGHHSFL